MRYLTPSLFLSLLISLFMSSCGDIDSNYQSASIIDANKEEVESLDESNRKIIKTAQITLEVNELEPSIVKLKAFLKPIDAYVYDYEIQNNSYEVDTYQKSLDSMVSVQKVSPEGHLSVRVPIQSADTFINYVLNSEARIASLKISDDDITEDLWEKKSIADVYTGSKKTIKNNSKNIAQNNATAVDAIRAKAEAAKMDFKTKHLWFDIQMHAKPLYSSSTMVAAKSYRTPIHIAFVQAIIKGWHFCADIILGLVSIWPMFILIGLILFVAKKFRWRTN